MEVFQAECEKCGMVKQTMQGVIGDMTITSRVLAVQGGCSGGGENGGDLISGINIALNMALTSGGAAGHAIFSGESVDNIHVDFVNADSGEIISSANSSDMGNGD